MQVVIDLPEEMWEQVKNGYVPLGISKYLKNGTPLSEHGRLIDADKIEFEYYYGEWFVTEAAIDHQPTVIEADVESEGKNDSI